MWQGQTWSELREGVDVETITMRRARREDVPAIVALLADDALGAGREDVADLDRYEAAFAVVDADPSELLVVADQGGAVVGTMQLSVLPGLSRRATTRLQIEGVRVASRLRGSGLGKHMFQWAIAYADEHGCGLVQLTTDRKRPDAHRFYERLGFVATHTGFKLER